MNANDHVETDGRIEELLLSWEERRDAGEAPTADQLCRDCPELASPLARRIEQLRRMDAMLGTPGETADETLLSERPTIDERLEELVSTRSTYHVERFHASGGRARIHVATDQQLHRSVAVKSLHPSIALDATARTRIQREAQITGRLEHPGILPVYGIGQTGDGHPFYCMRLVGGQTLRESITQFHSDDSNGECGEGVDPPTQESGRLAFARLLRHFVDVCNTIAYAHRHAVIHRDIKPENILLGEFGETFVVDWGLAKGISDDAAATPNPSPEDGGGGLGIEYGGGEFATLDENVTRVGSAIGTPAYMSPEQVRGEFDGIGEASDLFNLGATLYTLLTGQAPFGGERISDVLDKAERCEFPAPSAVRPSVSPPLEAICQKAMARIPSDRYGSVGNLASDIERWLADEPISCHPEPVALRLARWTRRHRTWAASGAVLLVTAVVALSASTVLIGRQKALADANFKRARQAVDDSFTKISQNQLLHVPGMQPLRTELLAETLNYYREFHAEQRDDPSLARDLAETALRLGEISRQIGKADDAVRYLVEGRDISERLARQSPDDVTLNLVAIRTNRHLGQAQLAAGDVDGATASIDNAVDRFRSLRQRRPDDTNVSAEGVELHLFRAGMQADGNDPQAALAPKQA